MDATDLEELRTRIRALEEEVARLRTPRTWPGADGVTLGTGGSVHPTCTLIAHSGRDIQIGERSKIMRDGEWVGPISIGSGCYINRSSYIRSHVTIGNDVLIGPFARIVTDTHSFGPHAKRGGKFGQTRITIGDGVWIGASVTIVGNVTIGPGAVVAAGAVVTADVPADTLVGGVPARFLRSLPA